ncbi:MAG: 16S rRNA (cytosine(1402)-N(4))-methyltransferase RsmH [Candidatus Taylorbacteria bacterium]
MSNDTEKGDVSVHESVLLQEVVELLTKSLSNSSSPLISPSSALRAPSSSPYYLDGTLGGAGHAVAIAKALAGKVNILGLDQDPRAIERAQRVLKSHLNTESKLILECENFRNMGKVLEKHDIKGVDMILLDLGFSSDELETSGKGFSFQRDEPLQMTMSSSDKHLFTAKSIVNNWTEEDIANVIYGYGEERFARRIARSIINYRTKKQIETTFELVDIIKMSVPAFYRRGKTNPATKTFQALRIAVNDELNALKIGLDMGYKALNVGGRMAIISFHSLEDRIVKDFYKEKGKDGANIITKKPIVASDQERAENPRSRSAKLRVIEKV